VVALHLDHSVSEQARFASGEGEKWEIEDRRLLPCLCHVHHRSL